MHHRHGHALLAKRSWSSVKRCFSSAPPGRPYRILDSSTFPFHVREHLLQRHEPSLSHQRQHFAVDEGVNPAPHFQVPSSAHADGAATKGDLVGADAGPSHLAEQRQTVSDLPLALKNKRCCKSLKLDGCWRKPFFLI